MEKKINALFVVFALCIPVYCNADTIGFDNSTFAPPPVSSPVVSNPTQNNAVASNPVPNNSNDASTTDSHIIAAVGYHSLNHNLSPQSPIVLTQNTDLGDCVDSNGAGVKSGGGNFSEETACPPGYIPYAIQTTKTPTDPSWWKQLVKVHTGTVYYRLHCCKTHVAYS